MTTSLRPNVLIVSLLLCFALAGPALLSLAAVPHPASRLPLTGGGISADQAFKEILHRQGLSQGEMKEFIEALQRAHYTARAWSDYGVNLERVLTLESLMRILEVSTW